MFAQPNGKPIDSDRDAWKALLEEAGVRPVIWGS